MTELLYTGTWATDDGEGQPAITDIFWGGLGNDAVYTSSGAFGALSSWTWTSQGLQQDDQVALLEAAAASSSADINLIELGANTYLSVIGGAADGMDVYSVNGTNIGSLTSIGGSFDDLNSGIWIEQGSGAFFVGSSQGDSDLTLWTVNESGVMTQAGSAVVGGENPEVGVSDLAHFAQNGQTYVVRVDVFGNSVTLLEASVDGLERVDRVDTADGLAINMPTNVDVVTFQGADYVIVTATGSNSISVLEANGGTLTLRDHVLDDLNTRFDNIGVLETVEVDGRVFIAVSGSDSGLTVFTLLPGGRLMSLVTLEDQIGASLEDITAMEFAQVGGELQLLVAGEGWDGLSVLELDTGDLFSANGTGQNVTGGAGDDILVDGAGSNILTGGAGADTFVFYEDGALDQINDFDVNEDEINLSFLGRAYSLEALQMTTIDGGINIQFNDEDLNVYSVDGSDILVSDLNYQMLFDVAHTSLAPLPIENQTVTNYDDATFLVGGAGNDVLLAGLVNTEFDIASGQVTRLFQTTLGREPAQAGHSLWTNLLLDGTMDGQSASAAFMASAEFQLLYGGATDSNFITLLYENVLGRAPAESGLTAWVNNLEAGMSRADVVWNFSESAELKNKMLTTVLQYTASEYQASWTDDVYRLFQATLGREPAQSGIEGWSEQLSNGMTYLDVVSLFVSGAEFQITYGAATDLEFVTLLYQNVLGRDPGEGGLAGWTSNLANGMSREEVVSHFAQSAEFLITSNNDLVAFMRELGPDNVIEGQEGDDILQGGALSDVFIFENESSGHDTIVDFEAWDIVQLIESNYDTADAILADLQQQGDDVVLMLDGGSITFLDIEKEEFDAVNFL